MNGRGNRSTRRKPSLVPRCPQQIPYDLTRARTVTAAVRSLLLRRVLTITLLCLLCLQPAALTSQPRLASGGVVGRSPRYRGGAMDLSYVTERIIALWVPGDVSPVAYRQGQQKAAHMLHTKHGDNYMVSFCFCNVNVRSYQRMVLMWQ
jgi:hypothetical protein